MCQIYVQGVHKCALLEPIFGLHFAKLTSEVAEIGYMKHYQICKIESKRDHPFKTSACLRGGGVKTWPNLPTDSSKKLPTGGGRGQKS